MKSKYLLFFSHLASFIRGRIFRLLKRILTILVLVTAAFAAYEYIAVRVKGYPREMHLMDSQYRIIPIHLEKRTTTHLHITRRDTQRFHICKIEDLHPMSQWQIHLYPITSNLNKAEKKEDSIDPIDPTLAARDRLIEANKKLEAKIGAAESDVAIRSLEREAERNLVKIRKLEASLDRYDVDYKPYKHGDDSDGLFERLSALLDRIANREDLTVE